MTLTDQAAEYAAEFNGAPAAVQGLMKRAFMFGALSALTSKAPREQMLAECVQFGRAIGTAAESAQA